MDPSFFWIAEHEDTPEAAEKYFERVVSMLVLHREKNLDFFMHEESGEKLYQHGIVPSEKHFESLFRNLRDRLEFNFQDLSKVLNEILVSHVTAGNCWPEAVLDIEEPIDVLTTQIANSDRRSISSNSVMHVGFAWGISGENYTYYFPRLQGDTSQIRVAIKVEISAVNSTAISDGTSLGVQLEAFSTAASLLRQIDEYEVWSAGADEDALSLAINVMAEKAFSIPLGNLKFSFGPNFYDTAAACGGIDGNLKSVLMNKILNILCAPESVEISVFRNTKDASSGPRTRPSDNAVAHRVHLTKKHEAFRLMFWKYKNGHIEFANVGPKFEERIL